MFMSSVGKVMSPDTISGVVVGKESSFCLKSAVSFPLSPCGLYRVQRTIS